MASFQAKELTKAQLESQDVDQSGSAYNLFKLAAQHMESVYGLSMDIQEKYGHRDDDDSDNDNDKNECEEGTEMKQQQKQQP